MKLVYFAWLRERIGKPEEHVELPNNVSTVAELLAWLQTRGDNYAYALETSEMIRVAVDKEYVADPDFRIEQAGEIALFPPMTGG